jgi:hypothetical protein
MEVVTGKLTGNHEKVEMGRERKAGEFDNNNVGGNTGMGGDSAY